MVWCAYVSKPLSVIDVHYCLFQGIFYTYWFTCKRASWDYNPIMFLHDRLLIGWAHKPQKSLRKARSSRSRVRLTSKRKRQCCFDQESIWQTCPQVLPNIGFTKYVGWSLRFCWYFYSFSAQPWICNRNLKHPQFFFFFSVETQNLHSERTCQKVLTLILTQGQRTIWRSKSASIFFFLSLNDRKLK